MGHHHHPGSYGGYHARLGTNWTVAAAFALVLFAYGAFVGGLDLHTMLRGASGHGVVTRVYDGTTLMEVEGRVCALDGEYGHVGQVLPVSFPHGRPNLCVVRSIDSFRWALGAMFFGGAIIAFALFGRSRIPSA